MGGLQFGSAGISCPFEGTANRIHFVLNDLLILTNHGGQFGMGNTIVGGNNHGKNLRENIFFFYYTTTKKKVKRKF
jgi:hypothetical protein